MTSNPINNDPLLYSICQLGKGTLFMMPKPRVESLESDITYYKQQGVTKVLSLLRTPEIQALQMTDEGLACEAQGLTFQNFEIKDMDVPELAELQQLNAQLKQEMENGHSIAIHCHGGRGRAGTVAITLMQEFGYEPEEAMKIAQEGRQDPNVPVCDNQRAFVLNYQTV